MSALPDSLPRDFGPAERMVLETAVYNALKYWEKAKELSTRGETEHGVREERAERADKHRRWPNRPSIAEIHSY
jgi:hypothetical protein